ncbi:MAG: hypothetical protein HYR85_21435 [Planctomycetes bacterium]|nr:hypothetical protein [Planctomycetota bacterium]MBI3844697.1 hypothetical protein [Planctomycetota bacterium]
MWFVISDPAQDADHVLIVNLTTLRDAPLIDECILDRGDHPFIRHPSRIAFARARVTTVAELEAAIAKGLLKPHADTSGALLERIVAAALVDPELSNEKKDLLRRQSEWRMASGSRRDSAAM